MEHRSLLDDVAGFAESMTERPMQVQEARRMRRNRYFFHQT
jgi:hypothetical protein